MNLEAFILELETTLEGITPGTLRPDTRFRELPMWDSLAALTTLSVVDSVFGVQITGDQLRQCQVLEDIAKLALSRRQ